MEKHFKKYELLKYDCMNMNKKYELLKDDCIFYQGITLFRIKALKDFGDIKAGDLGGYIQSEQNLSHEGNCWVYDDAQVYENAYIRCSAKIMSNAKAYGNALIFGSALVLNDAQIYGDAEVCGNAEVYGNAIVCDRALIYGNAKINKGTIVGEVRVPYKDIFQYQCEHRLLTAILTKNDKILYTIGCQSNMTEEAFINRIHTHNGGLKYNPNRKEYLKLIKIINIYFKGEE